MENHLRWADGLARSKGQDLRRSKGTALSGKSLMKKRKLAQTRVISVLNHEQTGRQSITQPTLAWVWKVQSALTFLSLSLSFQTSRPYSQNRLGQGEGFSQSDASLVSARFGWHLWMLGKVLVNNSCAETSSKVFIPDKEKKTLFQSVYSCV